MDDPRRLLKAIRARRRALEVSQTELGKAVGRSLSWMRHAELIRNDDDMTLGFYRRAAEVLRLDCRLELTLKK